MKFVGYMLFMLFLTMCRSYAHERDIFVKNASSDLGYVTCVYVPIYLVGDACTKFVSILLVYVSFYHVVVFFVYLRSTFLHL
jgi:hypothetical protein